MSIGLGITLVAIGAILAFAVNVTLDWISLSTVGVILMIAGFVVIAIGIALLVRRRNAISTSRTVIDPATGERITRSENSLPGDGI